jgi:KDO2-lipid IV(A) lauroyltransferase
LPFAGRLLYRLLRSAAWCCQPAPVYGGQRPNGIVELAQSALWTCGAAGDSALPRLKAKLALVRIESLDNFAAPYLQGKGVLLLTGHFGNWEVATVAGIGSFPQMRGRFHFVRRALKPDWFDRLVTRRFQRAGFGVLPKRGSLDAMLDRLTHGDAIVFAFDQHAQPPDGIPVDFFGTPAWTFKSLAIIALATGAPVVPATSWRERDGRHVLRFEAPIAAVEHANTSEAIRLTTRAYNAALERLVLRCPEQWYWVRRRWKTVEPRLSRRKMRTARA